MDLILWRHAEAEDGVGKPDTERELTKRGRKQAERMAEWLRPHVRDDWRILCSPAKRTRQTVKALERDFEESEDVGLEATASSVLRAAGWPEAGGVVVVVGHQPTLGQVAARLIDGAMGDVAVRKGSVWWFTSRERDGLRETVIKCVVDPEVLDG